MRPGKTHTPHVRHTTLSPEKVRYIREKLGLTQVELSRHLGLYDNAIRRYETGETFYPSRAASRLLWSYSKLVELFDRLNNHIIDNPISPITVSVIRDGLQIIREILP